MSEREGKFEKMLAAIQTEYDDTLGKMERLKAEGKTHARDLYLRYGFAENGEMCGNEIVAVYDLCH